MQLCVGLIAGGLAGLVVNVLLDEDFLAVDPWGFAAAAIAAAGGTACSCSRGRGAATSTNPSMADCLFCSIAAGETDAAIVWSDDDFVAFLDIRPLFKGHTLLVPRSTS